MAEAGELGGRTPYQVLGVPAHATEAQLRTAWRRAVRRTHPDYGGDVDQFHAVTAAWELLSSPESRADYDRRAGLSNTPRPTTDSFAPAPPSRTARSAPRRPAEVRYAPPLSSGPLTVGEIVVDAETARRRVHGAPPSAGILRGRRTARLQRGTVELLRTRVAAVLPAVRVLQGLRIRHGAFSTVRIDTLALCGDRAAIIAEIEAPADAYRWTGPELRSARRRIAVPDLGERISAVQRLLPEVHVGGFVVVVTRDGNPHAPLVEPEPTAFQNTVLTEAPGNPVAAERALKLFFGTGASTDLVDRQRLGTLLGALDGS
ncbi:J domain-containing protein [Micrococcaceae sp. AOP34-BR2-30]